MKIKSFFESLFLLPFHIIVFFIGVYMGYKYYNETRDLDQAFDKWELEKRLLGEVHPLHRVRGIISFIIWFIILILTNYVIKIIAN